MTNAGHIEPVVTERGAVRLWSSADDVALAMTDECLVDWHRAIRASLHGWRG